MATATNFTDVVNTLYEVAGDVMSQKGSYTLGRMRQVMALLDNPQNELNIVHVAGTSGKTSTCYYAAALLQAAGKKVGLTVSPHVDQINERVQINLQPLDEAKFCQYFNEFIGTPGLVELTPSYFESMVAFAYWVFAREQVDYAVVEVGLGGTFDGTNVVDRADKLCVITDIGLDHTKVLGDTIEQIAEQKAGIVHANNQVVIVDQSQAALTVIQQIASQQQAKLTIVRPKQIDYLQDLPPFKQRNWQVAQAAYRLLANRDGLPELTVEQLTRAAHTTVPARMEVIELGDKTIILDGSHNQQKLAALRAGIEARFADQPIALLTSFVQTKQDQFEDALQEIIPAVSSVIVTTYETGQDYLHQSLPLDEIIEACRKAGAQSIEGIEDPAEACQALLARPEKVLLVTGSFYLLNHVRPIIKERLNND